MWPGPLLLNLAAAAVELEEANTEVVEVEGTEIDEDLPEGVATELRFVEAVEASTRELGPATSAGSALVGINGMAIVDFGHEALVDLNNEALVDLAGESLLDLGGEAMEGLGELRAPPRQRRRGTSVTWWEDSTAETLSEPDTYTEHTLDSEDGSLSSTRASTNATTTGTASRPSQRSMRSFSVVVRGGRSPHSLLHGGGFRGRSVTRRERRMPSAALRNRHPTHTPSRGPARRGPVLMADPEPEPLLRHRSGRVGHLGVGVGLDIGLGLHSHRISRVREDQAEGGL